MVGGEKKEFIYELTFPEKTQSDTGKDFVEPLWARRKVGFILDQIRVNGEKKELIDEVVALAKRYGIATPYTSHLVVPDGVMPVVRQPGDPKFDPAKPTASPLPLSAPVAGGGFGGMGQSSGLPPGIAPTGPSGKPGSVEGFAKSQAGADGKALAGNRGANAEREVKEALDRLKTEKDADKRAKLTEEVLRYEMSKKVWDESNARFKGDKGGYQTGRLGVDLAQASNNLRNQSQLCLTANRVVQGRNCLEIGGVWIDDAYKADTKSLTVKAQSDAYFKILEQHPEMKDVFRLGNYVVWISPSGTALVVDQNDGKEKLEDAEIASLFAKK
jgi:Ca-activated chloride channel family protein